jgi:hypothetical protein
MPLKITKSTEVIETKRITMCLYAVPGIGKTSTASTAEKPLLLDFDRGSHRVRNRGDVVQVEKWEDVVNMTAEDFAPYKTAIVDTAGRALDVLTPKLIAGDPKMGRGGVLSLQGYGKLKGEFTSWLKMLNGFGLDVILISHSDEKQNGDEMIERLDMQGASKNEIYKSADVMGRLYLKNGKRMLNFSPADTAFGKNPANLPPIEVPDFEAEPHFLAGVIAQIKASLNKLSAAQVAAAALQTEWKARIDGAKTAEEFTALMEPAKASDETVRDNVKRLLLKSAKEKGFVLAMDASRFEASASAKPAAGPEVRSDSPPAMGPAGDAPKGDSSAATPTSPASSAPSTSSSPTSTPTSTPSEQPEDKGDAPTAAELGAAGKGQKELLKGGKGKAA